MARTPSVSDEEILEIAMGVMRQRGPKLFTLSEVASRVGLSRAAINLRFKSTKSLKLTLMKKIADGMERELKALSRTPGSDALLQLVDFLGALAKNKGAVVTTLNTHTANLLDPDMADIGKMQNDAIISAVSAAMPKIGIEHDDAVSLFYSHIVGCFFTWNDESETASSYLIRQTRVWLMMVGIPVEE